MDVRSKPIMDDLLSHAYPFFSFPFCFPFRAGSPFGLGPFHVANNDLSIGP
jgi:hypothetical protein